MECPNCHNIDKSSFRYRCTKAGMFVSYYKVTCKECGHTWEDRLEDFDL